jgi:hypothetical protein
VTGWRSNQLNCVPHADDRLIPSRVLRPLLFRAATIRPCRDRAATTCNLLDFNGTDGRVLDPLRSSLTWLTGPKSDPRWRAGCKAGCEQEGAESHQFMLYWIPSQCNIDSIATTRTSRAYTISLPPGLAQKAEALAKRDSRPMSALFREAFHIYYAQQSRKTLEEIGEYANGRNPGYTEADVPGVI